MCFIPGGKCCTKQDIRRQSIGTSSKDIILQCDQKGRCQKYLLITPKIFESQKYVIPFWFPKYLTFMIVCVPNIFYQNFVHFLWTQIHSLFCQNPFFLHFSILARVRILIWEVQQSLEFNLASLQPLMKYSYCKKQFKKVKKKLWPLPKYKKTKFWQKSDLRCVHKKCTFFGKICLEDTPSKMLSIQETKKVWNIFVTQIFLEL